jgi:hypothetical protein
MFYQSKKTYFTRHVFLITFLCLNFFCNTSQAQENLSAIKRQMIQESISRYSGNCACPYQYASNSSSCGKRSAYNRLGGHAPLCFEEDISDEEAKRWQSRR